MSIWPSYYPEGCPPQTATARHVVAFRLIRGNLPTSGDFVCHKLLFPHRPFKNNECCACGLSIYSSKEAAVAKARRHKNMPQSIAAGEISPHDGVSEDTFGEGHMTWWVLAKNPEMLFKACV